LPQAETHRKIRGRSQISGMKTGFKIEISDRWISSLIFLETWGDRLV
jgi:hypothetical protein